MTTNALELGIRELEAERTDALAQGKTLRDFLGHLNRKKPACRCGDKPKEFSHAEWCPRRKHAASRAECAGALLAIDTRCGEIRQELHRLRSALDVDFLKALRLVLKEKLSPEEFEATISEANARIEIERDRVLTKLATREGGGGGGFENAETRARAGCGEGQALREGEREARRNAKLCGGAPEAPELP